jgi:hypothetical protein
VCTTVFTIGQHYLERYVGRSRAVQRDGRVLGLWLRTFARLGAR